MSWLPVLPVLIPLLSAAILILLRASEILQRVLAVFAALASTVSSLLLMRMVTRSGALVSQLGGWPAPFGISFVADRLAALMSLVAGILVSLCLVYSFAETRRERVLLGFHPFLSVLLAGVNGAFLTGDLFNLYVWFEVLLINSFALLVLGSEKAQLRGAVPYAVMNLAASALLLAAIGMIYGMTGTLNMAELSRHLSLSHSSFSFLPVALLFLTALGIKAAVFPLFFWLPEAYPAPPVAVSAAFSGLLTKASVYAMIRFVTLFIAPEMGLLRQPLLIIAAMTMVTGVLGAASQNEFRRILSFHIISQIGYMIMGLAIFTPLGIAGAIYFIIHNIFAKSNLFLVSGLVRHLGGSFELKDLGGFYRTNPFLSLLFLTSAFSLAGLPPLSGFWGKLVLARAGLESREYLVIAVSLVVGVLTLFSMTKIWIQVFWKSAPAQRVGEGIRALNGTAFLAPITVLAALVVILGVWIEPITRYLIHAAEDLLDPARYVAVVLGSGG